MVRESRHLWVGNLPDSMRDNEIAEYFSRFGRVEKVKILPKKSPDGGLAAFVDFVDIRAATKANETTNYVGDRELRTNYNEPGNHPSGLGEGRGRGRPHIYERGHGSYHRRERIGPSFNDEEVPRRGGRYPYNDQRPGYPVKRPRPRRDSAGSQESDRAPSPKYARNRSASASSQSERGRSSSPEERSYSGSDSDARGKSSSPARSSGSGQPQKNASIQIKNLSTRPGDGSIKDALFHEFKKIGEIINVKIVGTEKERSALIKFRKNDDAVKSLDSNNKTFLGNEMKISIYKGSNKDKEGEASFNMYRKRHRSKDYGPEDVGFDPMATRTLFVGNLDKQMTHGDLRKIFEKYGDVVDVDIKKQNPGITTYAFLQFVDINGAMRAKHRMDREYIGRNRIKVGYGRGTPTNVIWLGNIAANATETQIQRHFHQFGYVTRVLLDRQCWQGLLSFDSIDAATAAFESMRGRHVLGKKLLVDFASKSCKEGFYDRMERAGNLDRRTLEPSPPPVRPAAGVYHSFQHAPFSRGRGFRGGFRGGYSGRYERGEFTEFSQGAPEYYQENFFPDDDYDDYEKELRDYGHRQRERERERETGRRPERDSSRNRERSGFYSRERSRDRKRGYTPLSDDEQPRSTEAKSDDDDYSEKDNIQSKIVRPNAGEKKRKSSDDPVREVSPEAVKESQAKPEKKEKKKKREKKEKSNRKKAKLEKQDSVLSEIGKEANNVNEASVDGAQVEDEKPLKPEKKKKRKSSEKGLAAEEKARRKELKKLKKLKKLQAELGKRYDIESSMIEEELNMKKEGADESGSKLVQKEEAPSVKMERMDSEDTIEKDPASEELQLKEESTADDNRPKTPPTPGLEEDEKSMDVPTGIQGNTEGVVSPKKEQEIKGTVGSGSETEQVEELRNSKKEQFDKEGVHESVKRNTDVSNEQEEDGKDLPEEDRFSEHKDFIRGEDIQSDSDTSDLVIDEMKDDQASPKELEITKERDDVSKKEVKTSKNDDDVTDAKEVEESTQEEDISEKEVDISRKMDGIDQNEEEKVEDNREVNSPIRDIKAKVAEIEEKIEVPDDEMAPVKEAVDDRDKEIKNVVEVEQEATKNEGSKDQGKGEPKIGETANMDVDENGVTKKDSNGDFDGNGAQKEMIEDAKEINGGKEGEFEEKETDEKLNKEVANKENGSLDDDSGSSKIEEEKDIYSSQSDSSDDLDDIDDEDDDDDDEDDDDDAEEDVEETNKSQKDDNLPSIARKDNIDGPSSPDKTPPTPDLEEDTLRMQGKYPGYGVFPKAFVDDGKDVSPFVESDEEKKELEKSLKEANYQRRMTGDEKKRHKKEKLGHQVSSSSDHDSDATASRKVKSPADKRRREEPKSRIEPARERRPSPLRRTLESEIRSFRGSPRDSPDFRERKDGRRDRGESQHHRDGMSRRRGSLDRAKSPDSRRTTPDRREFSSDRPKRDNATRKGSSERSSSPRRRHSVERRPGVMRGRERDVKEGRRGDETRVFDDERDLRGIREPPDFRNDREMIREGRDFRDRNFRDQRDFHDNRGLKEVRDRDFRGTRDIRGNEPPFGAFPDEAMRGKERLGPGRSFNRDRDIPGRGRGDMPDRGFERGGHRAPLPFRGPDRPGRHTPPIQTDQRSRSPLPRYQGSGERRPRSPEVRHEGRHPRSPEHSRPRSPVARAPERRRGRSQERRPTPPRSHERETDFLRKDTERTNYRDQPDRREREKERDRREKVKEDTPPPPPPPPEARKEQRPVESGVQPSIQQRTTGAVHTDSPSGTPVSMKTPNPPVSGGTPTPVHFTPPPPPPPTNADTLLDLLRRYPVMWQGLFALKNDSAAVQMHFLSGNVRLAEASLPRSQLAGEVPPPLRISQRMKLEASQLDGVNKRIKTANEHCMLLALPCGRDPLDVHAQTRALKTGFITYLQVKQAAGIINIVNSATKQPAYVLHIFPPCEFAQVHLARVAPDLLDSAADSGHLMVLITPV